MTHERMEGAVSEEDVAVVQNSIWTIDRVVDALEMIALDNPETLEDLNLDELRVDLDNISERIGVPQNDGGFHESAVGLYFEENLSVSLHIGEPANNETEGDEDLVSKDLTSLYLNLQGEEQLLTADQEISLAKRIERGKRASILLNALAVGSSEVLFQKFNEQAKSGQEAREHLARANTRLVVSIAKHFIRQGLPFDDLIQEGNVGLMRGVDKFDYRRGNRFSTYGTYWIKQAITRGLAEKSRTIRLPSHASNGIRKINRIIAEHLTSYGREPSTEEIAAAMEVKIETVNDWVGAPKHPVSLDDVYGDSEEELIHFVSDSNAEDPVLSSEEKMMRETILDAFSGLEEIEQRILRLRVGMGVEDDEHEAHTLEDIGAKLGLTRERIRQLEAKALRKLRHRENIRKLRDWV